MQSGAMEAIAAFSRGTVHRAVHKYHSSKIRYLKTK